MVQAQTGMSSSAYRHWQARNTFLACGLINKSRRPDPTTSTGNGPSTSDGPVGPLGQAATFSVFSLIFSCTHCRRQGIICTKRLPVRRGAQNVPKTSTFRYRYHRSVGQPPCVATGNGPGVASVFFTNASQRDNTWQCGICTETDNTAKKPLYVLTHGSVGCH